MKGYILDYTVQTNSGIISGDDNRHYNFQGEGWIECDPSRRYCQLTRIYGIC